MDTFDNDRLAPNERIAKVKKSFLGWEDHGILTAMLDVDYGGSGQGVGLHALATGKSEPSTETERWVKGLLAACGVRQWEKLVGRTIIVILDGEGFHATPIGIRPLPTEGGETFMFKKGDDV